MSFFIMKLPEIRTKDEKRLVYPIVITKNEIEQYTTQELVNFHIEMAKSVLMQVIEEYKDEHTPK